MGGEGRRGEGRGGEVGEGRSTCLPPHFDNPGNGPASSQLDVCPSRLVTVGDRSFASAGPKLWNSLPDDITLASSLYSERN